MILLPIIMEDGFEEPSNQLICNYIATTKIAKKYLEDQIEIRIRKNQLQYYF